MGRLSRIVAPLIVALLSVPVGAWAEGLLSGYGDVVGALSRSAADYRGGTFAPGLYAGDATLSAVTPGTSETDFTFAATEFKLHLNKDFGDKVYLAASLSFAGARGGGFVFDLQQMAVGLNFGDAHLTAGRFYAPIGIESVDADRRATATLSNLFAGLEPLFLTGVLASYAPECGVGGFVFFANNIQNGNDEARAGFSQSVDNAKAVGVGATLVGESFTATLQYNVDWSNGITAKAFEDATQLADLSVLFENESLLAGLDALYRRENGLGLAADMLGVEVLGALKRDKWTVGGRGELLFIWDDDGLFALDLNGDFITGDIAPAAVFLGDGKVYGLTSFVTSALADGAFVRLEYRLDVTDYTAGDLSNTQAVIAQLNASFE